MPSPDTCADSTRVHEPALTVAGLQLAVAVILLGVDSLLSPGLAVGMLYVVVVVMSLLRGGHPARIVAGVCSLFLLLGWALKAQAGVLLVVGTNRVLTVALLWLVALLVEKIARDGRRLQQQRESQQSDQLLLEQAHQRFRLAVEASPCAMIGVDRHGKIALVNALAESIFGYRAAEMVGRSVETLLPKRYRDGHRQLRESFLVRPSTRAMGSGRELSGLRKDGSEFPVEVGLNVTVTEGGEPFVLAAVMDINERKRAEEELRQFLEASPSPSFVIQSAGEILMVNSALEQTFGYERRELIGKKIEILLPLEANPAHPDINDEFFRHPRRMMLGHGRDIRGRRRDGFEFHVEIGLCPVDTRHGVCVVGAVVDIGEQLHWEEQLVRHAQELRRSNEELDAFVHVASHDLKAPLRAIASLTTWIEEDAGPLLPAPSREHLSLLRKRTLRMEKLLNDLLAYSRAGRTPVEPEEVDVRGMVEGVVEMLAPPAGFEVALSGPFPVLRTARAPLEQVFRNLLDNAIKHHDRGRGRIEVRAEASGDLAQFVVADDGPGIPREYHEKVFAMFQTLKPRDEVEGSGMGLAIVKKVVQRNGGSIRILPPEGRGTSFSFTWPTRPSQGVAA